MTFSCLRARSSFGALAGLLLLGISLAGCQSEGPPDSYVARVGSDYLTETDVEDMLDGMGATRDTTNAREQIIDQWITRTLLYREAQRLNLESVDEVQQKLEQQRRSILVTALKTRLYEEADLRPTPEDVRTYFERHKEKLHLREPYVSVRYLATDDRAASETVQQELLNLPVESDSAWTQLVQEHATDTTEAYHLSRRYLPESRLIQQLPLQAEELEPLQEGDITPVIEAEGQFHVLRLDRRISEGTPPQLEWVERDIRRRLRIRARKQMYANEVERLRNKAQANGALETP